MDIKVESKIGKLHLGEEQMFSFLSDCNNFQQFTAGQKIENWQSDTDSCSFSVDEIGSFTFRIVEKQPNNLVKFSIENTQVENVFLWVQFKSTNPNDHRIKLTAKLDVNLMTKMMISKPLKQGLDKLIDALEKIC